MSHQASTTAAAAPESDAPDSSSPQPVDQRQPLVRVPTTDGGDITILGSGGGCSLSRAGSLAGMRQESLGSVNSGTSTISSPSQVGTPSSTVGGSTAASYLSPTSALSPGPLSPSMYVLQSPEPVQITQASLEQASHGARVAMASGSEAVLLDGPAPSPSTPQSSTPRGRPPPATPSPPLPVSPPRVEKVLEFVALYSYDASPFARTSHTAGGPSGFDFISGGALKGSLEYRVPGTKDRPKGEDMQDALEHFVYPEGLSLEIAPTPPLLHNFVLTLANGSRQYAFSYTKWLQVPDHVLTVVKMQIGENLIDCDDPSPQHLPSALYGPHSLVFISAFPFYDSLTTTLKYMAERFFLAHVPTQPYCSPAAGAVVEKYIHPSLPSTIQLIDSIWAALKDISPQRVPLKMIDSQAQTMYPQALEFREAVTSLCAQEYRAPSAAEQQQLVEQLQREREREDQQQGDELDDEEESHRRDHSTSQRSRIRAPFILDTTAASPDPAIIKTQIDSALATCIQHCPFLLPAAPHDLLPLLESSTLGCLFESLDIGHVIAVWNALLCELPCLFVSEHISKLTPALEAISALLYPMKWPYVYIPVLPIFLTDVLDAPQPFLVGAPRAVLENLPETLISGETNIVIVDLDHNALCMSGNFEATQRRAQKAAAAQAIASRILLAGGKAPAKHVDAPEDANPYPDPFGTNARLITLLLQAQGVEKDDSAVGQLERLFLNNPVTYLGASLLDAASLAPSSLSLADLNPFRSAKDPTGGHCSGGQSGGGGTGGGAGSNCGANTGLDGVVTSPSGSGAVGAHSQGHSDGLNNTSGSVHDASSSSGEARHRFLPWNLVWRLYDGLSSILNPLWAQQREEQAEREREERRMENGLSTLSPTKPKPSHGSSHFRRVSESLSSLGTSVTAQAQAAVEAITPGVHELSSPAGGFALLASLPPNLPTHAWPVLLPGLIRELRLSLAVQAQQQQSTANGGARRRGAGGLLDLEAIDQVGLGSPLTYLGHEAFFLQRFQAALEKAKKPVLLLSTARFLYSGTDVSESEGELADEETNTQATTTASTQHTAQASRRPSFGHTPVRPSTSGGEQPSGDASKGSTVAAGSSKQDGHGSPQLGSLPAPTSMPASPAHGHAHSHGHHHHAQHMSSARMSDSPEPVPHLLHAASVPDASSSLGSPPLHPRSVLTSQHHLAGQGSSPELTRAMTATGGATASYTATSPAGSRLTPMTSDDEGEEGGPSRGELDDDFVPSSLSSTNRTALPPKFSKRSSEPSLGFGGSSDASGQRGPLSPFRAKQASLSHLSPPKIGGGAAGGGRAAFKAGGGAEGEEGVEESLTPLTPLTPATPAIFASDPHKRSLSTTTISPPNVTSATERRGSAMLAGSVEENEEHLQAETEEGDGDDAFLVVPSHGRRRSSIINEVLAPIPNANVAAEDNEDAFLMPPSQGRQRSSLINEVLGPIPPLSSGSTVPSGAKPSSSEDAAEGPSMLISIHAPALPESNPMPGDSPIPTGSPTSSTSSSSGATSRNTPTPLPIPRERILLPLRELPSSSPSSIWVSLTSADMLSLRRRFLSVLVSLLHSHRAFTGFAKKDLASGGGGGGGGQLGDEVDCYEVKFETFSYLRYMHRDYRPFLALFLETQMMKFFTEERLTRESSNATAATTATANPSVPKNDNLQSATSPTTGGLGSFQQSSSATSPTGPSVSSPSSSVAVASPSPSLSPPNDWFDRLCSQKRTRTRLLMNAWGENGLGGLLYKLGRKVPTWKERWFELNRHGTILRYYSHSTKMTDLEPQFRELKRRHKLSPRDVVTKANLDRVADQREKLRASLFRGEITILPGQTSVYIPNQTRKYMTPWSFEVVTPTRSLLACAPDLKTRDEWILCIRARAAKLSIDHKRIGHGPVGSSSSSSAAGLIGLGTVPHLESRLQMQLRLLREKNIQNLTQSFMQNLHRRQQKFIAGGGDDTSDGSVPQTPQSKRKKLPSSGSSMTLPNSSSSLSEVVPLSLPHALLVCEHLRTSLDLRKFSTLFKTHPHCFSGRDATHYILHQNLCDSLDDAVTLCNLMLTSGLILNVNHSAKEAFRDDVKFYYTFPSASLLSGSGSGESGGSSLLPTEEERVIVARMREEVDVRDRVHGLFRNLVKDSFVARDAIAWLMDRGICSNESAAVRLATRLVRTSQMIPVSTSFAGSSTSAPAATHVFESNGDLYKFHSAIRGMSSKTNLHDILPERQTRTKK